MKREGTDAVIEVRRNRRDCLLRDVVRSGGRSSWAHLFTHGHQFPTVMAAVRQEHLKAVRSYVYEITESGLRCLEGSEGRPELTSRSVATEEHE